MTQLESPTATGLHTVEVTVESNCGEAPGGRAVVSLDIDVE